MKVSSLFFFVGLLVSASAVQAQTAAPADPLVAAYQREFVFLDNEIRLLKERQKAVATDGDARIEASKKGLDDLEAQLLALTSKSAQMTEDLKVADSESQKTQDSFDLAQTIISQGNTRLTSAGLPVFSATDAGKSPTLKGAQRIQAELEYVFNSSVTLLDQVSSIRTAPGDFFLEDGRKVSGTVVQLGRIASFGSSAEGSGTLAPAGKDILRLVKTENAAAAQALAQGTPTPELPLYLYQGLDKNVEIHVEKSWQKSLEEGGPVAFVIVGVGVVGFLIAGLRALFLLGLARRDEARMKSIFDQVGADDLEGAATSSQSLKGSMGRVIRAAIAGLKSNPETVEDAIQAQILEEHPRLDRFRSLITVFVGAAPMLGLLGTVSGMIRVFDILTIFGTSDPKLVSGGISEALVTTALGLSVAIPLLLVGSLLTTWSDRVTGELEVRALRLVAHRHEGRRLAAVAS
jgi:biopolymer transport protein ExbB